MKEVNYKITVILQLTYENGDRTLARYNWFLSDLIILITHFTGKLEIEYKEKSGSYYLKCNNEDYENAIKKIELS